MDKQFKLMKGSHVIKAVSLIVATHIHTFLVTCFRKQKIGKVNWTKSLEYDTQQQIIAGGMRTNLMIVT